MKIYLSDLIHNQVLGDNQISGESDYVVPLNIASIASYAYQVFGDEISISLFKYPGELLDALSKEIPDVVGFANYIWNQDINMRIGSLLKERKPEAVTIMGGPAIHSDREGIRSFLEQHPYIDVYAMFEGEFPFVNFLRRLMDDGNRFLKSDSAITGCAYLVNGDLVYDNMPLIKEVDDLPSPYLNGMLDQFLEQRLIPLFETTRGCPFNCTFCAWGDVALNKVKKYPMERVFADMEYVAKNFPEMTAWILADANFGMLKRDVEVAKKIRDLKRATPALNNIILWESKNTTDRNIEIARLVGNDFGEVLMAVQTLDPAAQKAIKRDNIHLDDVPRKIEVFHGTGVQTATHVLSGLPGESYEGHLETLRKCFDLGFDHVEVFSTLLFAGAEMDNQLTRTTYGLKTKYRLRQGGYGEYLGIKSVECEEIVRETSVISESQMRSLRAVHWLIWFGWNHGYLKPILKLAHKTVGLNPVDVIVELVNGDKSDYPLLEAMFEDFARDSDAEWFDNQEELIEFYSSPEQWDDLLNTGFTKTEFKYNSIMVDNQTLFINLLNYLKAVLMRYAVSDHIDDILNVIVERRIEPDDIFSGRVAIKKALRIQPDLLSYVVEPGNSGPNSRNAGSTLGLRKSKADQEMARDLMKKFGYESDRFFAIQKTVGAVPNAFGYDLSVS